MSGESNVLSDVETGKKKISSNSEITEIVVVRANIVPVKGRTAYWVFHKNQVEHVIGDIEYSPVPFAQKHILGLSEWQSLVLPVVDLEMHCRLKKEKATTSNIKGVVVKTAFQGEEGIASRLILTFNHDIRVQQIHEECQPISITQEELEARGLKGIYKWKNDRLLIVPDLVRISSGEIKN